MLRRYATIVDRYGRRLFNSEHRPDQPRTFAGSAESVAIAASFQPQQRDKVAKFFDDGIGLDHS
jgi:hypothetical protein